MRNAWRGTCWFHSSTPIRSDDGASLSIAIKDPSRHHLSCPLPPYRKRSTRHLLISLDKTPVPTRKDSLPELPPYPMFPLISTKPSSDPISLVTLVGKRRLTSLGSLEALFRLNMLRIRISRKRGRYVTKQAHKIAAEGSIWDHMYVDAPESGW